MRRAQKQLRGLSPPVAEIFRRYDWAGNVRELRNVIERASILEDGEFITTEYLPADLTRGSGARGTAAAGQNSFFSLPEEGIPLETVELELARQALERSGGNLTHAAKLLHISRDQLRYKLKKT